MNKGQKKSLRLLIGLLAVLVIAFAAVVLINRQKAAKTAAENAASSANQITDADSVYSSLVYDNGTATLSFTKNADGVWSWADDPDFPLNNTDITELVNTISGLTPQQTITDGDTLDAYGLDSPAMTLTATQEDGTQTSVALGNQVAGSEDSYYMLLNGDQSTVYIVSDTLHLELSKGIYDMMTLPVLPILAEKELSSIQITGAQSVELTSTVTQAAGSAASSASSADSEPSVAWSCGGKDVSTNENVTSLVSGITSLTIDSCKDFKPTDEAVALCGLAKPLAVVTVDYTSDDGTPGSYTLSIGGATTDGDSLYVRLAGDTTIYAMSSGDLDPILTLAQGGLDA